MGDIYEIRVMEDGWCIQLMTDSEKETAISSAHRLSCVFPARSYEVWLAPVIGNAIKIAAFKGGEKLVDNRA